VPGQRPGAAALDCHHASSDGNNGLAGHTAVVLPRPQRRQRSAELRFRALPGAGSRGGVRGRPRRSSKRWSPASLPLS